MLAGQVQVHIPKFLGKTYKPGDVISAEDLAKISPQVRDAMVSQKQIVLIGDDKRPIEMHGATDQAMLAQLERLTERVDALGEQMKVLAAAVAPAPAKRARTRKGK